MVQTSRCGNTHRKPSSSSYREISQSSILVSTNIIWWWEWFTVTTQKTLFCRKTSLVHFKGLKPTINLELFIMPLVAHKLGKWSRQEKWIAPLWKAWDHCLRSQWVRPSSYIPKNAAEYESEPEVCLLPRVALRIFCFLSFDNFALYGTFIPALILQADNQQCKSFCIFDECGNGMDVHFATSHSILNTTQVYWTLHKYTEYRILNIWTDQLHFAQAWFLALNLSIWTAFILWSDAGIWISFLGLMNTLQFPWYMV